MGFCIAIDGPSGAGKSSLAKELAKKLNFIHVDTGALYRAIALYVINNNIDMYNEEEVVRNCIDVDISLEYLNGVQQVFLNGVNVSNDIRTLEVSRAGSVTSAYKGIRDKLLLLQRKLALENDVVMDGRDIGTHVLPDAQIKIFLTADIDMRAKRRRMEFLEKSINKSLEEVKADLVDRDFRDSHRKNNPLKKASDAVVLDSTNLTIDEEIEIIIKLYEEVKNEKINK